MILLLFRDVTTNELVMSKFLYIDLLVCSLPLVTWGQMFISLEVITPPGEILGDINQTVAFLVSKPL